MAREEYWLAWRDEVIRKETSTDGTKQYSKGFKILHQSTNEKELVFPGSI